MEIVMIFVYWKFDFDANITVTRKTNKLLDDGECRRKSEKVKEEQTKNGGKTILCG